MRIVLKKIDYVDEYALFFQENPKDNVIQVYRHRFVLLFKNLSKDWGLDYTFTAK